MELLESKSDVGLNERSINERKAKKELE